MLHKLHREYGEETLCARAMVSFMKLLTSVDPIAHAEEKARKTLTLLSRKNPERASARSQLLGEFSHEVKELSASSRTMSEHETRSSFVEGGKAWPLLDLIRSAHLKQLQAARSEQNVLGWNQTN